MRLGFGLRGSGAQGLRGSEGLACYLALCAERVVAVRVRGRVKGQGSHLALSAERVVAVEVGHVQLAVEVAAEQRQVAQALDDRVHEARVAQVGQPHLVRVGVRVRVGARVRVGVRVRG